MLKSIYVIVDTVGVTHTPLFLEATDESAVRQFSTFLSGVPFSPADYHLYRLGTWDADNFRILDTSFVPVRTGAAAAVVLDQESTLSPKDV